MDAPPCRIDLFGGLSLHRDGRTVEHFRTRKVASLLARLSLFPGRVHSREELIDLIWPEMEVDAGRVNLRQALCSLRRLLDGDRCAVPVVISDHHSIRLRPGSVATDVAEFEAALNGEGSGDTRLDSQMRAVDLYRGELLHGYYDEWVHPERRRLECLYLNALSDLQTALARAGDPARAIPFALLAIQVDPLDEAAHVAAMRLHAAAGDPASVRRQLDELAGILAKECGVPPGDETRCAAEYFWREAIANAPEWIRATQSPEDGELEGLRALRTRAFTTGAPEQRATARQRHAEVCLALAERAWVCWYGRDEEAWLSRFTEANEDLRSAVRWLLENDSEKAVQLCGALTRFWYVRNFPKEGYGWLREALERAPRARTVARARGLTGCALLSPMYDARAEAMCNEALAICAEREDMWGEGHALRHLGFFAGARAEFAEAKRYYDRALGTFTKLQDERGCAVTKLCLSFVLPGSAALSRADCLEYATQSLALFRKLENPWGISMALHSLGQLETDAARARALIQEAIAAYPEANGLSEKECHERAMLAWWKGDAAAGRRFMVREMEIARDRGNRMGVAFALEAIVKDPGVDATVAVRLCGALSELNAALGINSSPRLDPVYEALATRSSKECFDTLFNEGRGISLEQAVELVSDMC